MQTFNSNSIRVDQAEHQGYSITNQRLIFKDREYKYTEDTGTIFETIVENRVFTVSTVCDGFLFYHQHY
jgi:hypothetical protein